MANAELQIEVIKAGTGASPKKGSLVTVHYTGRFTDGKKFDSSVDRDEPFQFVLGAGQVIGGWDLGVAKMKIGDQSETHHPPAPRLRRGRLPRRDPSERDAYLRRRTPRDRLIPFPPADLPGPLFCFHRSPP